METDEVMGLCVACGTQRFGGRYIRYKPSAEAWVCLNCLMDWIDSWEIPPYPDSTPRS